MGEDVDDDSYDASVVVVGLADAENGCEADDGDDVDYGLVKAAAKVAMPIRRIRRALRR